MTKIGEGEHGEIRIRNQDIPVRTLMLDHRKLKFFVENPRIYSLVRSADREPDQKEILAQLLDLEHVRQLKEDIILNGGLIDPLIVLDGTLEVIEGNSRLAAYRWLAEGDPIKWSHVKCTLLPKDTEEALILALLGQYHIRGKKDWVPFEKAGFLYRRYGHHKQDIPTVAGELGIGRSEATHLIKVFEFMVKHGERNRDKWSYYDEFVKSKKIAKVREHYPTFDATVVSKIRSEEIKRAVDVRDQLPIICESSAKNVKRFVEGKIDFSEAYENALEAGGGSGEYRKLRTFRSWLARTDIQDEIRSTREKNIRDKMYYELKKIEEFSRSLKAKLEPEKARGED